MDKQNNRSRSVIIVVAALFLIMLFSCCMIVAILGVKEEKTQQTTQPTVNEELSQEVQKAKTRIASWSGKSSKQTTLFTITDDQFEIYWSSRETEKGFGYLGITLYDEKGNYIDLIANALGNDSNTTTIYTGPGKYYLDISAANTRWNVRVSEQRPVQSSKQ